MNNRGRHQFLSLLYTGYPAVQTFLDLMPCAAVIWGTNWAPQVVNHQCLRLIRLAHGFGIDPMFWINRVNSDDRRRLLNFRESLTAEQGLRVCDYRFLAGRDKKEIWLREASSRRQATNGNKGDCIISTYTDVSDLKLGARNIYHDHHDNRQKDEAAMALGDLAHEMRNDLQCIRIGVELALAKQECDPELKSVLDCVERLSRYVDSLPDSLRSAPSPGRSLVSYEIENP